MRNFFEPQLKEKFDAIIEKSKSLNIKPINKAHLFLTILECNRTSTYLNGYIEKEPNFKNYQNVNFCKEISKKIWEDLKNKTNNDNNVHYTQTFINIIIESAKISMSIEDNKYISCEDLLIALLVDDINTEDNQFLIGETNVFQTNEDAKQFISIIQESSIKNALKHKNRNEMNNELKDYSNSRKMNSMGGEEEYEFNENSVEEIESNIFININEKVKNKKIHHLVGREKEITTVVKTLCRLNQGNPIIIGPSGVGKTAIVEGLAEKINNDEVPESLKNYNILSLNIGSAVSGTRYRGDFEKKMINALEFIKKNNDKFILYIDEAHSIIGGGGSGDNSIDAANILKPYLSGSDIKCIASTTENEFIYFDKDPAISRRFKKIMLKEPSEEDTLLILKGIKENYEKHHNVLFKDEILTKIIKLSKDYIHSSSFPSKAINLLDDIGAQYSFNNKTNKRKEIEIQDIYNVISENTGMPIGDLSENQTNLLKDLQENIKNNIYGQDEQINAITETITSSFLGLGSDDSPIGSFLLVGPTGVGKTEICKQISKHLCMPLIRFDMSEFQEEHSISKLIGSPPGYVGSVEGGKLINMINNNPHSVVLFDEIEKAHPKILDLFLQIFDEGFVTDSKGKKCSFKKSIIFMTSNIGIKEISKQSIGFKKNNDVEEKPIDEKFLETYLKRELINRFDNIIQFSNINENNMIVIIDKEIDAFSKKLKEEKGIKLKISKGAKKVIAKNSYLENYGARPIKREIRKSIISPIAKIIVNSSESVKEFDIDSNKDKISIKTL